MLHLSRRSASATSARPIWNSSTFGFVRGSQRNVRRSSSPHLHGVGLSGGALELPLVSPEKLIPGKVHLRQASVRGADLIHTRRSALRSPVTEEVEEMIADSDLDYTPARSWKAASATAYASILSSRARELLPRYSRCSVRIRHRLTFGPTRLSVIGTIWTRLNEMNSESRFSTSDSIHTARKICASRGTARWSCPSRIGWDCGTFSRREGLTRQRWPVTPPAARARAFRPRSARAGGWRAWRRRAAGGAIRACRDSRSRWRRG